MVLLSSGVRLDRAAGVAYPPPGGWTEEAAAQLAAEVVARDVTPPPGAVVVRFGPCGSARRVPELERRGRFTVAESDARAEAARMVGDAAVRASVRVACERTEQSRLRVMARVLDREVHDLAARGHHGHAEALAKLVGGLLDLAGELECEVGHA